MNNESLDYDFLVREYQTLWKNRNLIGDDNRSETSLKQLITKELLDEYSHPRVRKSRYEKYYSSVKKILASAMMPEVKLALIQLYDKQMEELGE